MTKFISNIRRFAAIALAVLAFGSLTACDSDEDEAGTPAESGYYSRERFIELKPSLFPYVYVQGDGLKESEYCIKFQTDKGYLIDKTKVDQYTYSYISPVYNDGEMIVLPEIIVQLKSGNADIDGIIDRFKDNSGRKILSVDADKGDGRYYLSVKASTSAEVLRIANSIHGLDGVKWCEPEMLVQINFAH